MTPPDTAARQPIRALCIGMIVAQGLVMVILVVMWSAFGWRAFVATFAAVLGGQLWAVNLFLIHARRRSDA